MNPKKIVPVVIALIGISAIFIYMSNTNVTSKQIDGNDFSYSDSTIIRNELLSKDIFMSAPTKISDYTVKEYCMYFDQNNNQKIMNQCFTSAITDSTGDPLGNINMGGDANDAQMALAILTTNDLKSRQEVITSVFEILVKTLVCDCWNEQHPGGFSSVESWIDAAKTYYVESGQDSTKSKISGLAGKQLILEITKDNGSYLWTLIVVK